MTLSSFQTVRRSPAGRLARAFWCRLVPLAVLLLVLLTAGCQRDQQQTVRRSRLLMGTVVEIVALAPASLPADAAVERAFAEMARIEQLMSPSVAGSDVERLSGESGPIEVSAETAAVLRLGQEVARASGGAFDLTLGRLKKLWGIETDTPRVPAEDELRQALAGVGPEALILDGRRVSKRDPALEIDLGGIAKGYAIDRAIELLAQAGIHHASVNAGGDIRLLGDRAGRTWRIGIQHPRQPEALLATLDLADCSVVTSGDYERYFEVAGRRYHHLFDPQTGRPARLCQSVTVVTERAALADALATAAFVLGPERGLELLGRYRAEGIIVDAAGKSWTTAGLAGKVAWR